ncbi:MAG: formylmethanofuran dehydrogenase subunit C [Alphaproteobacteria bacterium]|nr:formylmethanofuran dehydrogenase subunit C [Alphaproteobacteria bacterium]
MTILLTAKNIGSETKTQRISLNSITPERLIGLSESEIAKLPIRVGKEFCDLAEIFTFRHKAENSDPPRMQIIPQGLILDHIGRGLTAGEIDIEGAAGAYVGAGMSGGKITLHGQADYGAGLAMTGGQITLYGNAATQLAGARPGALTGMAGGVIIVHGDALGDVAMGMKRGLVVVKGRVLGMTGATMIGGTIMVMGRMSGNIGVAMRKGSILALGGFADSHGNAQALPHLPSFADCLSHDLGIMRLWQREAASLGLDDIADRLTAPRTFHRLMGDRAQNGIGEILFPE